MRDRRGLHGVRHPVQERARRCDGDLLSPGRVRGDTGDPRQVELGLPGEEGAEFGETQVVPVGLVEDVLRRLERG